jgi:hypothetical protein
LMKFRIWRKSENYEYYADATYTVGNGTFGYGSYAILQLAATMTVPVELSTFTIAIEGKAAILQWETKSEANNWGFEIERRQDQASYSKIGFVKGNGTTAAVHSYQFKDADLLSGNYSYRLKQIDLDGTANYSQAHSIQVGQTPQFALEQNYPNPFNPKTTITYSLPEAQQVTMTIYNSQGQQIVILVDAYQPAGEYRVSWQADDQPSGVYMCTIKAGGISEKMKLVLMK